MAQQPLHKEDKQVNIEEQLEFQKKVISEEYKNLKDKEIDLPPLKRKKPTSRLKSFKRRNESMIASSHQTFGLTWGLLGLTIAQTVQITPTSLIDHLIYFSLVLFGALVPDIDSPNTKLGRKFWFAFILLVATFLALYIKFPDLIKPIEQEIETIGILLIPLIFVFLGHRKFTHSLLFMALVTFYCSLAVEFFSVPWFYLVGFLIGVASHLGGDFLTHRGIPVFYPFIKKKFHFIWTFETGKRKERQLIYLLSIMNIAFIGFYIWKGIL